MLVEFFCSEMDGGRVNEYVYYLPELYQIKTEVSPGLYRVHGCISGHRKVATEDTLAAANIKNRADVTNPQLIGLRQELDIAKLKNESLEKQLQSGEKHINGEREEQRRKILELEFDNRVQREKIRRLGEDLERQKILVKTQRNKTRVTEKFIRELKQKNLIQRPFTQYEILFVKDDTDVEDIKRNYKKLAAFTHPDAGGCEEHFKTIHRAYRILSNQNARNIYDTLGLEGAEEELTRRANWSD